MFEDGWGLTIRRPGIRLDFHNIQFPYVHEHYVFLRGWLLPGVWSERITWSLMVFTGPRRVRRIDHFPPTAAIVCHPFVEIDLMPLYELLQARRKSGDMAEPVIDWMLEHELLELPSWLSN